LEKVKINMKIIQHFLLHHLNSSLLF
jgi:hypothetical protein